MKVLALTRYDKHAASSRYRFAQYIPYLRSQDIDIDLVPLLGSPRLTNDKAIDFFALRRMLAAYMARIRMLLRAKQDQYDLIWLQIEAFPWLPAGFELSLLKVKGSLPYVAEYDDAWFHRYDNHWSRFVRSLLGNKIGKIMAGACLVIAGNPYIANHARAAGAQRIEQVPTVIDLSLYPAVELARPAPQNRPFTVGWIGSQSTTRHLATLKECAQLFTAQHDVRFVAIGADPSLLAEMPIETRTWASATEVAEMQTFHVGIMPLPDTDFERGKCGFKLIQYMACGLPVIASPVGVNREIVEHGVNGFLASTPAEWLNALHTLSAHPDLRYKMGQMGRRKVEQQYCLQVTAPRMESLLRNSLHGFQR